MRRAVALISFVCLLCSCRLVLVGDSHTNGGCTDNPCQSFASSMEMELDQYEIINMGIPGVSLVFYGCGNRYDDIADFVSGSTVQIMGGSNDSGMGYAAAGYAGCLNIFLNRLIEDGVSRIVLLTPPPPNGMTPARSQLLYEYRNAVLEICATNDRVECGPDLWTFLGPEHFGDGATHMNQAGHDAVADALIDFYESGAL